MSDTVAFVIRSFSFPLPLPSALSTPQILFVLPGFQRIFGFLEVSNGQGLLSHVGGYLCPVAFLPYIAFLYSVVKVHCRYRGGVKFCLYSITVPLCIAAAALVPPARPAGYGQPAFECSVICFPASPVPCGLSFCRFRWLLPLLPTFDFLPKGLLS